MRAVKKVLLRAKTKNNSNNNHTHKKLNASHSVTACIVKQLVWIGLNTESFTHHGIAAAATTKTNSTDVATVFDLPLDQSIGDTTSFRVQMCGVWEFVYRVLTRSTNKPISYQLCLSISLNKFLPCNDRVASPTHRHTDRPTNRHTNTSTHFHLAIHSFTLFYTHIHHFAKKKRNTCVNLVQQLLNTQQIRTEISQNSIATTIVERTRIASDCLKKSLWLFKEKSCGLMKWASSSERSRNWWVVPFAINWPKRWNIF